MPLKVKNFKDEQQKTFLESKKSHESTEKIRDISEAETQKDKIL